MVALVVAPGAMLTVVVGFLVAAVVLARAARTEVGAREAIVDLWAMALLTVSALATAGHAVALPQQASVIAPPAASDPAVALSALHHGGVPTSVFELMVSPVVIITAWMLARAALGVTARRTGSIPHSLVSAAATAAQLLLMLLVH
ncbi:hypothetical protein ACEXQE_06890 [Herbiconiux sp. P17]|uniref:hypothetical protein n=1 Tax=Herbiconiux wuyangfengii TaxID=3342794 RepID=UPI0035B99763